MTGPVTRTEFRRNRLQFTAIYFSGRQALITGTTYRSLRFSSSSIVEVNIDVCIGANEASPLQIAHNARFSASQTLRFPLTISGSSRKNRYMQQYVGIQIHRRIPNKGYSGRETLFINRQISWIFNTNTDRDRLDAGYSQEEPYYPIVSLKNPWHFDGNKTWLSLPTHNT